MCVISSHGTLRGLRFKIEILIGKKFSFQCMYQNWTDILADSKYLRKPTVTHWYVVEIVMLRIV